MYAKIVDEQTKLCDVGLGTDTEFYKSIGMEEMEVEQAYDGQWYIKGYAPEPPVPTPEEIKQELINGIQTYMNTTAQTKGYDDIFTAISYENSEDEIFKAEGKACRVWRDRVWRSCYNILDEVLAGKREIPTLEELIAELPKIDW